MKKAINITILFSIVATLAYAQDLKIVTVNMTHLFDNYYKLEDAQEKFNARIEKNKEELKIMQEDAKVLIEAYNKLVEETKNPALSKEKRDQAQAKTESKKQQIIEKQNEMREFMKTSQQSIIQTQQNFRILIIEEIKEIVLKEAKKHNATLLLDTSSPVQDKDLNTILYSKSEWDITDEVLKTLNKNASKRK
jgi:Skp family chaperone for outer membrane proteins